MAFLFLFYRVESMKILFITIGQPKLPFVKQALPKYLKRISRFVSFDCISVKENAKTDTLVLKHAEGKKLILLDEKGKLFSTKELASFLERERYASDDLCFVVGGADGHSSLLREKASLLWSLSPLTFPHDFATLLGVEALYRGFSILENHPYHRA